MTRIYLSTYINAPIYAVFDAARNIDLHMDSATKTKEKAITGRTSGCIELDETVTWRGKHFGLFLTHTSKITSLNYPYQFTDEMIKGHFKTFKHQHIFKTTKNGTDMIDILDYQTPYSFLGMLFDKWALKKHLTTFLYERNQYIKNTIDNTI